MSANESHSASIYVEMKTMMLVSVSKKHFWGRRGRGRTDEHKGLKRGGLLLKGFTNL